MTRHGASGFQFATIWQLQLKGSQMFDAIRKAVHPDGLKAELEAVQAELETRLAGREQRRRDYVQLFSDRQADISQISDKQMNATAADIECDQQEIKALRRRRAELNQLLAPISPIKASLVSVPMPSALVKVNQQLSDASEKRQALRSKLHRDTGAREGQSAAKRTAAEIEALEAEILQLRARRTEVRRPYDDAVAEALAPLTKAAADRLLVAAIAANEALAILREAAEIMPSLIPSGVGGVWQIDQLPLSASIAFALSLGGMPSEEVAE